MVGHATSITEAMAAMATIEVDVVSLDVRVPGMEGQETPLPGDGNDDDEGLDLGPCCVPSPYE